MIENTVENQITAIVNAWNDATKGHVSPSNARRFCMQGEVARAVVQGEIKPEEVSILARFIIWENSQASERRFRKQLDLYKMLTNIAQFESRVKLAEDHFRNFKPKTNREKILAATGRGEPLSVEPKRISMETVCAALKAAN